MRQMNITFAYGLSLFYSLMLVSSVYAINISGGFGPDETLQVFSNLGPTSKVLDEDGGFWRFTGSVDLPNNNQVNYKVLMMVCNEEKTDCANLSLSYEWSAPENQALCVANAWEEMRSETDPRGLYAFDSVRFVKEYFIAEKPNESDLTEIANQWQHSLESIDKLIEADIKCN